MQPITPRRAAILVVEDQESVRSTLCQWLQMLFPEIEIHAVGDAATAHKVIRQSKIDIVLLDVRLPDIDGVATTRSLLIHDGNLKIIAMSSYGGQMYHAPALAAGAIGFVSKYKIMTQLQPLLDRLLASRTELT